MNRIEQENSNKESKKLSKFAKAKSHNVDVDKDAQQKFPSKDSKKSRASIRDAEQVQKSVGSMFFERQEAQN